uniref:Metastriate one of each protein family n=1 Tax=Rhipicephalus appendiculatus TaxID=34631 RepID=A0A131YPX6_RHIAP
MVALAVTFAVLAVFQLGSASNNDYSLVSARCDNTPEIDWTGTINAYLRRIPQSIPISGSKEKTWIMGFKTSTPEVTGLGSMWAYKPPYSFCVANRTLIEVEAFADDPLRINVEWKSCTGSTGKLGTTISTTRLRLYFTVDPTPEEPHRIQLHNIAPESIDDARLYVSGTNPGLTEFLEGLGVFFLPHLQLFWSRFIRVDAVGILREDLKI